MAFPQPLLDVLAAGDDRPAFEHNDRVVSAAELLGIIRRIAAGLRAAGLGPGDGIALMNGVTPEAYAAIMAAHTLGARVVPVPSGLTPGQLEHVLAMDIT